MFTVQKKFSFPVSEEHEIVVRDNVVEIHHQPPAFVERLPMLIGVAIGAVMVTVLLFILLMLVFELPQLINRPNWVKDVFVWLLLAAAICLGSVFCGWISLTFLRTALQIPTKVINSTDGIRIQERLWRVNILNRRFDPSALVRTSISIAPHASRHYKYFYRIKIVDRWWHWTDLVPLTGCHSPAAALRESRAITTILHNVIGVEIVEKLKRG